MLAASAMHRVAIRVNAVCGSTGVDLQGILDGILDERPSEGFGHEQTVRNEELVSSQLLPVGKLSHHKQACAIEGVL